MDNRRKYFHIMGLEAGKPHGFPVENLCTPVDKTVPVEAVNELYPPLPGFEWMPHFDDRAAARFYEKFGIMDEVTGCIPWLGGCTGHGYGAFAIAGRVISAHVIALVDMNRYPDGEEWPMHVHHTCENPVCVNHSHLMWVTPAEHLDIHREIELARSDG